MDDIEGVFFTEPTTANPKPLMGERDANSNDSFPIGLNCGTENSLSQEIYYTITHGNDNLFLAASCYVHLTEQIPIEDLCHQFD